MALIKRESRAVEPYDVFGRFDRLFDEWTKALPFRGALEAWRPSQFEEVIRVDEFREGDTLVVRAELPGIDPEKDVEVTVTDGMLHIEAQRREEERQESAGYLRRELRYGSFNRTLGLPEGVTESDVTATFKDGILEVRVQVPEKAQEAAQPKQIPVNRG